MSIKIITCIYMNPKKYTSLNPRILKYLLTGILRIFEI